MHPGIQPILNTVLETLPGLENLDKHTKFVWIYFSLYWDVYSSMALTKEEFHRGFLSPLFQFNNTQSG